MDILSRYHLAQHEEGSWHVIDARTGGPAEIEVDGKFFVFWKLPKEEAERWSVFLNQIATFRQPAHSKYHDDPRLYTAFKRSTAIAVSQT